MDRYIKPVILKIMERYIKPVILKIMDRYIKPVILKIMERQRHDYSGPTHTPQYYQKDLSV